MGPDELEALTARVFKAADPSMVEDLRADVRRAKALAADLLAGYRQVIVAQWIMARCASAAGYQRLLYSRNERRLTERGRAAEARPAVQDLRYTHPTNPAIWAS